MNDAKVKQQTWLEGVLQDLESAKKGLWDINNKVEDVVVKFSGSKPCSVIQAKDEPETIPDRVGRELSSIFETIDVINSKLRELDNYI